VEELENLLVGRERCLPLPGLQTWFREITLWRKFENWH